MIKMILIGGAAAAGGYLVAQQSDKFFAKSTIDDNLSAGKKEALRNGIAAGSGIGLYAVLSKVL